MLATKLRALNAENQKLKGQSKALKDTVIRYQKELKEARQKKAVKRTPPARPKPSATTRKPAPVPPAVKPKPKAPPKVVAKAPTKPSNVALVNINKASVNDLVLYLGLTQEMAQGVVANRPYRLRGELVAKKVVPKATFDVIKDRITAAP